MARRHKHKKDKDKQKLDPFERARLKKLRAAARREEKKRLRREAKERGEDYSPRKKAPVVTKWHDPNNIEWLRTISIRSVAVKIINESYREPAPYWLSVPKDPRPEPVDYYPCRSIERGGRIWMGFLFRQHRDEQLERWNNLDARKEFTSNAAEKIGGVLYRGGMIDRS